MIILSICLIGWIVEHRNAESWKKTAIILNRQLDNKFMTHRSQMKKMSEESELLKAENEELKHREGRIKDFCRGASASTQNRQSVPWEAD